MNRNWSMITLVALLLGGLQFQPVQAEDPTVVPKQQIDIGFADDLDFDSLFDLLDVSLLSGNSEGSDESDLFNVAAVRGSHHHGHHGHRHHKPLTEDQKLELGKLMAGNMGRLLILHAELHVTGDQKTKMKSAFRGHKDAMKGHGKTICNAIRALDEATANDENDAAIKKSVDELGNALGGAVLEILKAAHDARNVLTKDQQQSIQRTTVAMIKAHEDFEKKTGLCPVGAMIRAKHGKGHHDSKHRGHHWKHSSKSHGKKHSKSHSEKKAAFKRMAVGNIGRLMVLYSDLDISGDQRDNIKSSVRQHAKNMKPRLVSIKGNLKPVVLAVTSDQSDKDLKKVSQDMGSSIAGVAMEITQARRDIRKVLTKDQKNKIKNTRADIKKSVEEFRSKMKQSKKQPKI